MTENREQGRWQKGQKEPIAIIGIGCRLPGGANSPEEFWKLLQDGVDTITEVPAERWNLDLFYDSDPAEPGKMYTRWGGFIEQIDYFDAKFFGISRQEAARMDPQHRLLLEVVWEALEDAGQPPESLASTKTGVFMGICSSDYGQIQASSLNSDLINAYSAIGIVSSMVTNRLCYHFDFNGPSIPVDTACSSSLVAVHLACSSLWNGECTLALAGGVNAIFRPEISVALSKAFLLSADGRCKTFDAEADGFVRSEGAGVVVLKPLSSALADGDPIYAVIRASAISQDGHKDSIAASKGEAQERVMREAYRQAGISSHEVQYIEAQGTGTVVGDVTEANAVGSVVGINRLPEDQCLIGSVKSNIGHLEAAAGVAGLIKTALALKHGYIPQNLHLKTPNPKINFEQLRLRVPQTLEPWPNHGQKSRLAGVNSFGVGGTNVHVILEGAETFGVSSKEALADNQQEDEASADQLQLFLLSARSLEALSAFALAYLKFLTTEGANASISLSDICYTVSLRRSHHHHRLAAIASSKEELAKLLRSFVDSAESQIKVLCSPTLEKNERSLILQSLGQRYIQGESIDWNVLYPKPGRFVRLPSYPWQRQRYWQESEASRQTRLGQLRSSQVSELLPVAQLELTSESENKTTGNNSVQIPDVQDKHTKQNLNHRTAGELYSRVITYIQQQVAITLDLNVSQLDLKMPLQDLGFSSLMALELKNQVKTDWDVDIPLVKLIERPSVVELAKFVSDRLSGIVANSTLPSCIVPLQLEGTNPPFFCLPPLAGVSFPYYELACLLGKKRPFYALHSLGIDKSERPLTRIEDIARYNIEAIRLVQRQGPYYIGGWSLGAIVAFEMARQLHQQGQQVAKVILIDTAPPTANKITNFWVSCNFFLTSAMPNIWPYIYDYFALSFVNNQQLRKKLGKRGVVPGVEKLSGLVASLSKLLNLRQLAALRVVQVILTNSQATIDYTPSTYPGKVSLFRTSRPPYATLNLPDETWNWGDLTSGQVEVHHIPGSHFSILRPPHVQVLAEKLKACLDQE
ncbi:hypothetical protein I8748_04295 [Nostoc sp. CENA67]|uniref:Carrier domain-containing protein n=1 Tax=Amazonocrinis nigriterrae CENA67 TaxID=2794033 RepID=A0A8J7HN26_9NOST|nr:beta-ketoacyl synthase N-terminal-like domain-containing protein [Amazonocrinis nigriterrae]MBH8561405.1 hypothetical protein [Amazonocrinis nigriterrae CENA67]